MPDCCELSKHGSLHDHPMGKIEKQCNCGHILEQHKFMYSQKCDGKWLDRYICKAMFCRCGRKYVIRAEIAPANQTEEQQRASEKRMRESLERL